MSSAIINLKKIDYTNEDRLMMIESIKSGDVTVDYDDCILLSQTDDKRINEICDALNKEDYGNRYLVLTFEYRLNDEDEEYNEIELEKLRAKFLKEKENVITNLNKTIENKERKINEIQREIEIDNAIKLHYTEDLSHSFEMYEVILTKLHKKYPMLYSLNLCKVEDIVYELQQIEGNLTFSNAQLALYRAIEKNSNDTVITERIIDRGNNELPLPERLNQAKLSIINQADIIQKDRGFDYRNVNIEMNDLDDQYIHVVGYIKFSSKEDYKPYADLPLNLK